MAQTKAASTRKRSAASKSGGGAGSARRNAGGQRGSSNRQSTNGVQRIVQRTPGRPIAIGAAALVGVAGAAAAAATRVSGRKKVMGVPLPRRNGLKRDARKVTSAVSDAARRADRLGQRVSRVASSVHQAAESLDDAAKKA